jgi:hypothetical protein
MVEPLSTLLYNNEAQRRDKMSKNTKIRGLVWLALAFIVVVAVGSASYSVQSTNLDGLQIFEDKTEAQIGLEFLEIYSFQYEERPIISETRADYTFDVHRSNLNGTTNDTNLYVVFKDLVVSVVNGEKIPDIGVIDTFVYCSTEEDPYHRLIASERLGAIPGTNVFAHFLLLPTRAVNDCPDNLFHFVVDVPQLIEPGQSASEEIEVIELIPISSIYDLQSVSTGALLDLNVNLNNGFSGDLSKSTYNIISIQRAFINSALSTPLVLPLAYGLWYATEKEIFNESVSLRELKAKPKKKSGK